MALKHVPLRMCIVCRELKPRQELIRLVLKKDRGKIFPDPAYVESGKGVYVCNKEVCISKLGRDRRLKRRYTAKFAPGVWEWLLSKAGGQDHF